MKTLNEIAAAAYAAHAKELGRLVGVNALPWVELQRVEMLCWEQATRQVLAEATAMGLRVPDDADPSVQDSVLAAPRASDSQVDRAWAAVNALPGCRVPWGEVATWSREQCHTALCWATAVSQRQRGHHVVVPPVPAFVAVFAHGWKA